MKPSKHFSGLDIIRLFCAMWVMSFHYFLGLTGDLSWYRFGNFGVPIFFIISGFVISQSIRSGNIQKFITGRFIRLFPLFWILCTITYIFTLLMPNGKPVRIQEYLISMTMLGDKFGSFLGYPGLVDPVYWSLSVELIFYCSIGLFVYFFSWKHIRYYLWGWLFISIASYITHTDTDFLMKLLLVRHASYFIFGATLALIVNSEDTTYKEKRQDIFLLILTGLYSAIISFKALPPYFVPNHLDTTIVTLLHPFFFLLIIVALRYSQTLEKYISPKVCAIIGGLTYPLYLLHQTIGRTIIDYFSNLGTQTIRGAILIPCMLCISYLAYLFDKKMRSHLNKYFEQK